MSVKPTFEEFVTFLIEGTHKREEQEPRLRDFVETKLKLVWTDDATKLQCHEAKLVTELLLQSESPEYDPRWTWIHFTKRLEAGDRFLTFPCFRKLQKAPLVLHNQHQ